ncbi:hypothetical protein TNCV_1110361 [Trichonephila clavipes]|nr:hypothetical protein TNCV_1110361 [Trichonephila clavipes]
MSYTKLNKNKGFTDAKQLTKTGEETGTEKKKATCSSLTSQELYSKGRSKLDLMWRIPHMHQWYTGTSPDSLLEIKCDHGSQTALDRLTSGHLKCLPFDSGRKIFLTLVKIAMNHPASPDHILG